MNFNVMIKANELRIGNTVGVNVINQFMVGNVATLEKGGLTIDGGVYCTYKHLCSLRLNEFMLSQFGAKKVGAGEWFFIDCYFLELDGNGFIFNIENKLGVHTLKKISYVHELQNLFFALTGQELTYTSKQLSTHQQ